MFEKKAINTVLFMQNKASEGPLFEANWAIHTIINVKQDTVKPSEIIKMEML